MRGGADICFLELLPETNELAIDEYLGEIPLAWWGVNCGDDDGDDDGDDCKNGCGEGSDSNKKICNED